MPCCWVVQAGALPANTPGLSLDTNSPPFSLISFALSLLLVFRTNASYSRWAEARAIWGGVTNRSRDILRQVCHQVAVTAVDIAAVMRSTHVHMWYLLEIRSAANVPVQWASPCLQSDISLPPIGLEICCAVCILLSQLDHCDGACSHPTRSWDLDRLERSSGSPSTESCLETFLLSVSGD